jgi:hypothetical protein
VALRLTIGFSDNPRVEPLKDGTVRPQNIELGFVTLDPSTLFQRNLFYDEFDVSEMSISETLLARERTDGKKWDWSALPIFLSRGHHWPYLYVNTASGIASLADMRGKRIGVPDYDMTAALCDRWGGTQIAGNPRLRKLLPDDGKAVVFEYYRKTGFFQANHHVIVQNRVLREHPWVALELFDAFRRSKEIAYERARRYASAYLYFPGTDRQEQAAVFGADPYPLGLRAMGKNVERAIRGSLEQGLLTRPLRLDDIYYRTTLHT